MNKKILIALIVVVSIRVFIFVALNVKEWDVFKLMKPIEFGVVSNPVPVWLTDEQRREHGLNYDNLEVFLMHNKVVNYSLSYLSHYLDYYRGDFLFTDGKFLYLFDALFIGIGFYLIIKKPKGWKVILIWLFVAPILPALDLQPPNELKAIGMYLPLVIISSFGALRLINLIFRLANGVK